ncbi:MAG: sigma-54 dependent transcriptional regulator [Desulfococcaceae bacterium]
MNAILLLSRRPETGDRVRASLPECRITWVRRAETAQSILSETRHDLLLADLEALFPSAAEAESHPIDFPNAFQPFWTLQPSLEIVVITPSNRTREAVQAVKAGAANYLPEPVTAEEVRLLVDNLAAARKRDSELDYLRDQFWESDARDIVRTASPRMREVFDKLRSAAPTRTTILLYGETGVGKGVLARLIHRHSNRREGPFIGVHCGAIPDTLIESELFGHEKGAFTGAVRRKPGKFEIAGGGTLFLDEIGTITPAAQVKLLQVLQERTFHRVGGETPLEANVRIIAATNSDLKTLSDAGQFRKDLYYRLSVFPVEAPALRDRLEDIPALSAHFIEKLNRNYGKSVRDIHPEVLRAFAGYDWPGNIRELENLIERAYILERSAVLTPESFPAELFPAQPARPRLPLQPGDTLAEVRRRAVAEVERHYLESLLARHGGRIRPSAEQAGISTRQLHKLLTRYGIQKERFK